MKNIELMAILSSFPENADVYIEDNDTGWTLKIAGAEIRDTGDIYITDEGYLRKNE